MEAGKAGVNGCRERLFPADVTFWGMLGQVFRGSILRDSVREVQASVCAADGERDLGNSTGSYSDARQRLPQDSVDVVHRRVCEKMMSSGGVAGRAARHGRGRHLGATGRHSGQSKGVLPTGREETQLRVSGDADSGSV